MFTRFVLLLAFVALYLSPVDVSGLQAGAGDKPCYCAEDAAKAVAARIKKNLNGKKSVFLCDFAGFRMGNVAFPKLIGEELQRLGLSVGEKADADIRGSISSIKKNGTIVGYKIMFMVVFKDGSDTKPDTVEVLNHNEGLVLLAETGQTRPDPEEKLKEPDSKPSLNGETRVYPRPGALFSVEILVKVGNAYSPCKVTLDPNGYPRVELKIGEAYAVKIYNDTDYEMVAAVTIDGLSRFALSDKERDRKYAGDIVPKRGTRLITGYYKNSDKDYAFKVGKYENSEAAKLLPTPDCGNICVTFRASVEPGKPFPPGENDLPITSPLGTEKGPIVPAPTITVLRDIGNIRSVIRIRY